MTVEIWPLVGIGEIAPGDDIGRVVSEHPGATLRHDDVVVVTSKIVSKAAGLATRRPKDELLDAETDRVVATRGETRIVRTHHGLTLAAAGIDASNAHPGTLLTLPVDPDADARAIRRTIRELTGVRVAVIITDTAGRAWRIGQTDIAIGCAGIVPGESFAGATDSYGNPLVVTEPAVADEIAGAAELAAGKLDGTPVAVVRGLRASWFGDDDGPGAAALIRDEDGDMFGLGAKDAVLAAVAGTTRRGFPLPEPDAVATLLAAAQGGIDPGLARVENDGSRIVIVLGADTPAGWRVTGALAERVRVLAHALGVELPIEAPV